jgi:hypothetical protein
VRQKLCRRLEGLEKAHADAERARPIVVDRRKLDRLWADVEAWRAVPENLQWLAAQPPEYFGIQVRQLKQQLMEKAHGYVR